MEEVFESHDVEGNLSFLLEFDESLVIDFVELETTGGVDLESLFVLIDFVVGEFSIMGEGNGLVEQ